MRMTATAATHAHTQLTKAPWKSLLKGLEVRILVGWTAATSGSQFFWYKRRCAMPYQSPVDAFKEGMGFDVLGTSS